MEKKRYIRKSLWEAVIIMALSYGARRAEPRILVLFRVVLPGRPIYRPAVRCRVVDDFGAF